MPAVLAPRHTHQGMFVSSKYWSGTFLWFPEMDRSIGTSRACRRQSLAVESPGEGLDIGLVALDHRLRGPVGTPETHHTIEARRDQLRPVRDSRPGSGPVDRGPGAPARPSHRLPTAGPSDRCSPEARCLPSGLQATEMTRSAVPFEHRSRSTINAPQPNRGVIAAGSQPRTVGTPGHRTDPRSMSLEYRPGSAVRLPQPHRAVTASGRQSLAVGAPGYGRNGSRMADRAR